MAKRQQALNKKSLYSTTTTRLMMMMMMIIFIGLLKDKAQVDGFFGRLFGGALMSHKNYPGG